MMRWRVSSEACDVGWLKMDVHSTLPAMVVFGELQRRAVGGGGERLDFSCRTRRQIITNFLSVTPNESAAIIGAFYSRLKSH